MKGFYTIYKCADYCIVRVLDWKANISFSLNTNWCCTLHSRYTKYLGQSLSYRILFKDKISMRLSVPNGITQVKEISFGLGGKNDNTKVGLPICKDNPLYNQLDNESKFYYYQQISPRYDDIFKFDIKDYGIRNELVNRIRIVGLNIYAKNAILDDIRKNLTK